MIKYLLRGVFSLVATPAICVAIYMGWHIGMPPAAALFWPEVQGEISVYTSTPLIDGSAKVWTYPMVQLEGVSEPLRLVTSQQDDSELVKSLWPIGRSEYFKVSEKLQEAVWVDDPARGDYLVPFGLSILAIGMLIIVNGWLAPFIFGAVGTIKVAYMVVGIGMLTLPTLITYAFWIEDVPPTTSIFWPRETVTVKGFDVDIPLDSDEKTYVQPTITLIREDGSLAELAGVFSLRVDDTNDLSQDFTIGETVQVKRAPDGRIYHDTLLNYWATFVATLFLPLFLLTGVITFWRGLTLPLLAKVSDS
tara:strand:+ start:7931 stop:8848 length:918 start_codon:yes stop_codon:yes gene_type:complete